MSLLLDHRVVCQIHFQSVLHYHRVDAGHFLGTEGDDVPIFPQEVNQGVSGPPSLGPINHAIGTSFVQGDLFQADGIKAWSIKFGQS